MLSGSAARNGRVESSARFPPEATESRGIRRGVSAAWSEGGPLLIASRVCRLGAGILQRSAESLELSGAGRSVRKFRATSLDKAIEFAETFGYAGISLRPMQVRSEIQTFLEFLASDPPRTVLEIGTARGGTLFLFGQIARDDALLISMDFTEGTPRFAGTSKYRRRGRLYRSLGRGRQRVVFLGSDSHRPETRAQLERVLSNRAIDLLFIDGDHTLAGVEADFRMYSPLVRSRGIVAFHDIVPGPPEAVGDVPSFWKQIRTADSLEIVEDWGQGGYGIGILRT